MKKLIASFTLIFAAACGTGVDAPPPSKSVASSREALLDAPEDLTHTFAVGLCMGEILPDGSCQGARCSGTLVAPNLVLTARHCLQEIDWVDPSAFCGGNTFSTRPLAPTTFVTAGRSTSDPGTQWSQVRDVIVEPTADVCRDDIAFVVLSQPIVGVRPAGISTRWLTNHTPRSVAVVGRGAVRERYDMTDYSYAEFDSGGDRRRILENIPFRCVSNVDGTCREVDFFSQGNEYAMQKETFSFGSSVLSGDSGAGVFDQAQFSRRQYEVLGVAVTTTIAADGSTTASQATRVDQHRLLAWRAWFAAARAACGH